MSTQEDSKPVDKRAWTEILKGDDNDKLYWEQSYKVIVNCVNMTNKLPIVDESDVGSQALSRQVLAKLNNFLANQKPEVKMSTNNDLNMSKLKDWNDKKIDDFKIRTENIKDHAYATTASSEVAANNNMITTTAQIHEIPQRSVHVRHKLTFENTGELWKPKLKVKPNALRPFQLSIIDSNYNDPISYKNPYAFEIESFSPDSFVQSEPESMLPESLEDTPLTYIDTVSQLEALIEHLQDVTTLAVDLEHHSLHSYMGITCLMQITTKTGGDFIIDVLELYDHIHKLNIVFTNPAILKVFHGADNDVKWLQRDFGVYIVGLFDTHQAAILLQFPVRTLQYLVRFYCNVELNKEYQKADWRIRPLPDEMITYARMDTHYLLYIYQTIKEDLLSTTGDENVLKIAFKKSQDIAKSHYKLDIATNDRAHLDRWISAKRFNAFQKALVDELFMWRDIVAREHDESTAYVLPNHQLLMIAAYNPKSSKDIIPYCQPMPPFVTKHLSDIDKLIKKCHEKFPRMSGTALPNETVTSGDYYKTKLYTPHNISNAADASLPNPIPIKGSPVIHSDDIFNPNKKNPFDFNFDDNDTDFVAPFDRYIKYSDISQITDTNLNVKPICKVEPDNTITSDIVGINKNTSGCHKASTCGIFEANTSGTPTESASLFRKANSSVISNVSAASLFKTYTLGNYGPNITDISKQSTAKIYGLRTSGIENARTSRVDKQSISDIFEVSSTNDDVDGSYSDTREAYSPSDFYEESSSVIEKYSLQRSSDMYEAVTSGIQQYALQQGIPDGYEADTTGIQQYEIQQSTPGIYDADTSGIQQYTLQQSTPEFFEMNTSGIQQYALQQYTSDICEASTPGLPMRARKRRSSSIYETSASGIKNYTLKESSSDIYDTGNSGILKRACKRSTSIYEAGTSGIPKRALKQSTSDVYDASSGTTKHAYKPFISDTDEASTSSTSSSDKASDSNRRQTRSSVSKKNF